MLGIAIAIWIASAFVSIPEILVLLAKIIVGLYAVWFVFLLVLTMFDN